MEIRTGLEGAIRVLSLDGEFDATEVDGFSAEISRVLEAGSFRVLLDLEAVTFIDSSAIQAILEAEQRLEEGGGGVAIVKPRSFVEKVLRLLELGRRIPIVRSREEAAARLAGGAGEAAG